MTQPTRIFDCSTFSTELDPLEFRLAPEVVAKHHELFEFEGAPTWSRQMSAGWWNVRHRRRVPDGVVHAGDLLVGRVAARRTQEMAS